MEDAERGRGRNSLLASCVHLYFTALSISSSVAAARHTQIKRERDGEWESFAPGHCGGVMASLSLKVFAHIKSVCFGPKQNTRFVASTYFSGYFYNVPACCNLSRETTRRKTLSSFSGGETRLAHNPVQSGGVQSTNTKLGIWCEVMAEISLKVLRGDRRNASMSWVHLISAVVTILVHPCIIFCLDGIGLWCHQANMGIRSLLLS